MSATAAGMVVEGVVLAVVLLFLVAVLRSHAEILRRLAVVEASGDEEPRAARPSRPGSGPAVARDIAGETLDGDAVKVSLGPGTPDTLLAFLSSGCASCGPMWSALGQDTAGPANTRLVVVTKGPEAESLSRLQDLAMPGARVVMSTQAWQDFSVPATPHFVMVDGKTGSVAGRGSATSWEQLLTLVEQAAADSAEHARRGQSSSERARRAQEALASAGITAGHPSLYPTRAEQQEGTA